MTSIPSNCRKILWQNSIYMNSNIFLNFELEFKPNKKPRTFEFKLCANRPDIELNKSKLWSQRTRECKLTRKNVFDFCDQHIKIDGIRSKSPPVRISGQNLRLKISDGHNLRGHNLRRSKSPMVKISDGQNLRQKKQTI